MSTSQVYTYSIPAADEFFTGSYPAFWLRPGEGQFAPVWGNCNSPGKPASNTTALSNYLFYKIVKVGYLGLQNVIKIDTSMYIPEGVSSASIESFVGAMNSADFPQVMTYDVVNKTANTVDDPNAYPYGQTWVNKPLIFASSDGQYALGIYNRELIQSSNSNLSIGHYRWNEVPEYGVNTWSSVFDFGATSGSYNRYFTNYLIIGTLQDVLDTMDTLHSYLP
jgi:hypothetical protein